MLLPKNFTSEGGKGDHRDGCGRGGWRVGWQGGQQEGPGVG